MKTKEDRLKPKFSRDVEFYLQLRTWQNSRAINCYGCDTSEANARCKQIEEANDRAVGTRLLKRKKN